MLIDVTTFFSRQARKLDGIEAVLLTHAHRDAAGGMAQLRGWLRERTNDPVPVYAAERTIGHLRSRFRRLDHCDFRATRPGRSFRIGGLAIRAVEVPHARDERYPTFAWRIAAEDRTLVYASDVGELTPALRRVSRGALLLVIDGAMWRRSLFSHLTIDAALPELCGWRADRILLTQIGKTAPPHERLARAVRDICRIAAPAYDDMRVEL